MGNYVYYGSDSKIGSYEHKQRSKRRAVRRFLNHFEMGNGRFKSLADFMAHPESWENLGRTRHIWQSNFAHPVHKRKANKLVRMLYNDMANMGEDAVLPTGAAYKRHYAMNDWLF